MALIDFLEKKNSDKSILSEATEKILGTVSFTGTTIPSDDLPVGVSSSDWITIPDPERLYREYTFIKFEQLVYFINETLKYQQESQHHAKITIDNLSVSVETYTHDINSVTQQDINLAKYFDEIYSDISFLSMRFENE